MTQHLSDDEREALGLTPNDEVEFLGEDHADPDGVARARMESTAQLSELLVGPILTDPDFIPIKAEVSNSAGFGRWLRDPQIYSLPANADVVRGESLRLDEMTIVDARSEGALVRLDAGHEWIVAKLEGERAVVFRTSRRSRLQVPALPEVEGAVEPPPLDCEALLGAEAEAWLTEASSGLAESPDALDRLSAVGLLLRAWRPVGREAWEREAARVRSGEAGIVQRARGWMETVSDERLDALSKAACAEAGALPEQADALRIALLRDDEQGAAIATGMVLARDDLESIHAALALVGRGSELAEALASVDEELTLQLTAWTSCIAGVRRRIGARIDALAAREPETYWLQVFG